MSKDTYKIYENKDEIIERADIEKVLNYYNCPTQKKGNIIHSDCPSCGAATDKKKPAFQLKKYPNETIGKCFKCNFGANAYNIVVLKENCKSEDLQIIIPKLAEIHNIPLIEKEVKPKTRKEISKPIVAPQTAIDMSHRKNMFTSINEIPIDSFAYKQITESGLTIDDIISTKIEIINGVATRVNIKRFVAGTKDGKEIVPGDDMIIRFLNLDRTETYFRMKDKQGNYLAKLYLMTRIRFQVPEHHPDKEGKPQKYASPYGSGSPLYWSEVMLKMYEEGRTFDTLYIQEGEKKAEKACKHGILSVGIMGIHNILQNEQLSEDFRTIILKCNVKKVVFVVDSDWKELKYDTESKFSVDHRINSFYQAVNKFKLYFQALNSNNPNVDINLFFAHGLNNELKGIDDLLCSEEIKGNEEIVRTELTNLLNEPIGKGKYFQTHNITTISVSALQEIFGVATREQFIDRHIDVLKTYAKFNYKGTFLRVNDNNDIELAQPLAPEELFYEKSINKNRQLEIKWRPHKFHKYLTNQGIGQYILSYQQSVVNECFLHCNTNNKTVKKTRTKDIRFYVLNTLQNIGEYDVYDYVVNNEKYLGDSTLNNLPYMDVQIIESSKVNQNIYFDNCYWSITKDGIQQKELADLSGYIWEHQVKNFSPKLSSEQLVRVIRKDDDTFDLKFNDSAKNAHFLQFLWNTSNDFKLFKHEDLTDEQRQKIVRNFVNKLTGIGYYLHRFFNPSVAKAVIAIDNNDDTTGYSQGRTGKSILIQFFEYFQNIWKIDGKKYDLEADKNKYGDMDENTAGVCFDDVRAGFNLEMLYSQITGNMKTRQMYSKEMVIPREKTPKFFITTNFTIKGAMSSSSSKDRIFFMPFSNYYNENHKPVDDFGLLFFDEWDYEQWNFYYELCASCLQIYFEHGLVEADLEDFAKKSYKAEIGENIVAWFDEYFHTDNHRLNRDLERKEIQSAFVTKFTTAKGTPTPNFFSDRFKKWCKYKEFILNPDIPTKDKTSSHGGEFKKGGVEYYYIQTPNLDEPNTIKPNETQAQISFTKDDELPF